MRKWILLVLVPLVLTSCNTILVFHMDVLRPSYSILPTDNKSLLLIDNSGLQPADFAHSYTEEGVYKSDTSFNTDTLSTLILESVSELVSDQRFYDQVDVCDRKNNPFRKDRNRDYYDASMLTPSQIHELSDSGKVDVLVSLDQVIIQTKTNMSTNDYIYAATRDVKVYMAWSAFDVKADSLLSQFQYLDSLYWVNYDVKAHSAISSLPGVESTLPEIGDVLAEKLAMIVSPYWETVNRVYFTSGSVRMKYAVDCLRNDDWDGAATLWRDELENGFGRSTYRAAMNMMLYEEFVHTPDDALAWVANVEKAMNECLLGATDYDKWYFGRLKEFLQVRSIEYAKLKRFLVENQN